MVKIRIRAPLAAATVVALVAVGVAAASATRAASTRQTVTVTAPDGTTLAATLFVPSGTPPAGGWPAVVFFHGLGGSRADTEKVAEQMGIAGESYVALAPDARGHGDSGGLVTIDGPKEVADARALFTWLRDRPDVRDDRIGAWGISYGGGITWNTLVAGVPWAAIEVVETWTDLAGALVPQGLVKSGVVAGFVGEVPAGKLDPEVQAVQQAAFAGQTSTIAPWLGARSSLPSLATVTTPVFLMQGRRDFAFGIDQAERAWAQLKGPKRLWYGLHGHAPSTFPAADSGAMLAEGAKWFTQYLRGEPATLDSTKPVMVAPESWKGAPVRYPGLPKRVTARFELTGTTAIGVAGKIVRRTPPLSTFTEAFGTPTVTTTVTASKGWSRLVAVLSAKTPGGKEIVVAGGGVPVAQGKGTYRLRLSSQATGIPRGSRLFVTFGSSSLAQNPANLLYLNLPLPAGARVSVGPATLRLPVLATPVSR
ncbi:MAG: CocE/NonD family hydrolase [Gaiellales bacterium]